MQASPSNASLNSFREAAQSLKLYRRAELVGTDGEELIEKLYVDPLPNNHILQTLIRSNSTFLIGRKGTGKSTVFQRAQYELRKHADVATAYIDIKSVHESSRVDNDLMASASKYDGTMPKASLERLLLNRAFVTEIIQSIRNELEKKITAEPMWKRVQRTFSGSAAELFSGLDELLDNASSDSFQTVLGTFMRESKLTIGEASNNSTEASAGGKASASPVASAQIDARLSSARANSSTSEEQSTHTDILMRVFDLRSFVGQLKKVLESAGIRHLFVFLDDFSELPEASMRVVVDTLIAPLNNWSDELIKFKIAAYPTRIYFGDIDRTKTDEINLDLHSLYGAKDVAMMEVKAVDFTKRLLLKRLGYYGAEPIAHFFDGEPSDELWRQLFFASMANPRNLGWILFFAYEEALLYGRPIGSAVIKTATRKYYEEKIAASFEMNRFLRESFAERSSIFSLKDLLEGIVGKARELRTSSALVMKDIPGRKPSSHFHVSASRESLLSTLELNFFVTKYVGMRDRDGREVAVYALNYGLCQAENIEFGRPSGSRDSRYRQYFAERIFDFTPILDAYVKKNQEIVCDHCTERHEASQLSALLMFEMLCPSCKIGTCQIVNLSRKYEPMLRQVDEASLLPSVELGILHTLKSAKKPPNASDVAAELDCSYQLVGRRAKHLDERGLLDRSENGKNRRIYRATELARSVYFEYDDDVE